MLRTEYVKFLFNCNKIFSCLVFPFDARKRRNYQEKFWLKQKHYKGDVGNIIDIPVFIVSYNHLEYLQNMLNQLLKYKFNNIHIVDNCSTDPLLQAFLDNCSCATVHHMDKNYGHTAVWSSGCFDDIINKKIYIVTDPDIEFNNELPDDFVRNMVKLLVAFPYITKVGFALDIVNIAKEWKEKVVVWEQKYYENNIKYHGLELYYAKIDTTFAIYRPGKLRCFSEQFYCAIRIAGNYTAKHLPWCKMTKSKDDINYAKTANASASWLNKQKGLQ